MNETTTSLAMIDDVVNSVVDNFGEKIATLTSDVDKIEAIKKLQEFLLAEKKSLAENAQKELKAQKEEEKKAADLKGAELAKNIEVGDKITFIVGTGKNVKQLTKTVEKVSEKSITIDLGEDTPAEGKTSKRYIKFAKVLSVEKNDGTILNAEVA